jgi:hypothetical protein
MTPNDIINEAQLTAHDNNPNLPVIHNMAD